MEIHRIAPRAVQMHQKRGDRVLFFDSRRGRTWDLSCEQLPGAYRIPGEHLGQFLADVPHEAILILYGKDGCDEACEVEYGILRTAGFPHVFVLDGGLDAWVEAGLSTEVKGGAEMAPTA